MSRSLALAAAVMVAAVTAWVTGCTDNSNAGPPTVVCGTTLSADSEAVYDATVQHPGGNYSPMDVGLQIGYGVMHASPRSGDDLFYILVARGCAHGSDVTWTPSSSFRLVTAARAQDGQMVAVVLHECGPDVSARLIATSNGKVVASATVRGVPLPSTPGDPKGRCVPG